MAILLPKFTPTEQTCAQYSRNKRCRSPAIVLTATCAEIQSPVIASAACVTHHVDGPFIKVIARFCHRTSVQQNTSDVQVALARRIMQRCAAGAIDPMHVSACGYECSSGGGTAAVSSASQRCLARAL